MTLNFRGLFEPHEMMTGDRRMFKAMCLTNRDLPLPLMMRTSSGGHQGAEIVGEITKIENGPKGRWYSGQFLDPKMVPEVAKAIYMAKKKLIGPSVDLDRSFTVEPRPHSDGRPMAYFTSGNVIGVTLVPMPAFADVTFEVMTEDVEDAIASLQASGFRPFWKRLAAYNADGNPLPAAWAITDIESEFAVSQANWDGIPLAPRDYKFDADDAVKRIAQWSGIGTPQADTNKYASMFLWRGGNQTGDSLAQEDFRMPIGDIINGQPHLVFHAIYAAAALLSGAHGGLPNVPEEDKNAIKGVINQIYPKMAQAFGDESMHSPFVSGQGGQQMSQPVEEFAAGKMEPYGDVDYADPGYRDNRKRYPIDTAAHVRAAWAYINVPKNAAFYAPEQLEAIKEKIKAAAEKFDVEISEDAGESGEMSMEELEKYGELTCGKKDGDGKSDAEMNLDLGELTEFAVKSSGMKRPPMSAFENPHLDKPTPFTVTDDGRVFGHLGKWGECHLGIGDKCVILPHSKIDYQLFRSGTVKTAEGVDLQVGKITLGTGHANPFYGIVPSREHYDNSGWCAAVVMPYEDQFGVAVAGVVTDPSKIDELRRSPLSGDWRRYNGHLELVAALAVNNPGFPVFHMEESEEFSLCAAGIVKHPAMDVPAEFADQPPQSLYVPVDYDEVKTEVEAALLASLERKDRLKAIRGTGDQLLRARRMRRFAAITGEEVPPSATIPAPPKSGMKGKPAPQGTDSDGDGEIDPDADPNTPGIAEVDDPGRETLMARMRSGRYTVIDEPEEPEEDKTQPTQ